MTKYLISLFAMIFLYGSALAEDSRAEIIWIDVRSPEEFAEDHLAAAINIPHNEIGNRITAVTTDKQAEIRLYCRSGGRAGMAKQTLEALGYTQVVNDKHLKGARTAYQRAQ